MILFVAAVRCGKMIELFLRSYVPERSLASPRNSNNVLLKQALKLISALITDGSGCHQCAHRLHHNFLARDAGGSL